VPLELSHQFIADDAQLASIANAGVAPATRWLSNKHLFVLIRPVNRFAVAPEQHLNRPPQADEQGRQFAHRLQHAGLHFDSRAFNAILRARQQAVNLDDLFLR
jgi:hypothetical protein